MGHRSADVIATARHIGSVAAQTGASLQRGGLEGTRPRHGTVPSLRASPTVIQRAGHAEDLLFVSGSKWLIKRADATEAGEYQSFEQNPAAAPPTLPTFHGPFASRAALLQATDGLGIQFSFSEFEKLTKMANGLGARRLFVLSSAKRGAPDADLKDLKLGKYTASGTDQERRGAGFFAKQAKITMHNAMDIASGSRSRGFRDEDQWQKTPKTQKATAASINLGPFESMLAGSSLAALAAIAGDLGKIKVWLTSTTTVYVGMSILVVSNPDNPEDSNATTIDFEHPITTADSSFATHQAGMIEGVDNILALVNQEAVKKKAVDPVAASVVSAEDFLEEL